jgi:Uncharacterised nucleotidyltransferase
MRDARLLTWVLADPMRALDLTAQNWASLITMAQAERLLGSLAVRLEGLPVPETAARVFERAKRATAQERQAALWEAEMARRALAPLGVPVILLKGTAFVAAGLDAGQGRHIGDLDILVPRAAMPQVERAVQDAGWSFVKDDPYDDHYYRTWMHELPPMMHDERDRLIDIHHTILPITARVRPDADALIAAAAPLENGLYTLSPEDMVLHAVAHLFADGDLEGGLRNLWDMDRLIREFADRDPEFWTRLKARSNLHSLTPYLSRALRLCHHLYETPVDPYLAWKPRQGDIYYIGRLLARNGWGQETRKILRKAFYIRSHWIRMPPVLLAQHLSTKWWKARKKK